MTPLEAWALQQLYELHDETEARLTEAEREIRSTAPTDQMHGRAQVAALWPIHDRIERATIEFRARMTPEDLAEHMGEDEEEAQQPSGGAWQAILTSVGVFVVVCAMLFLASWGLAKLKVVERLLGPDPPKVVSTDGSGLHEFSAYPGAPPGACSIVTGGCRATFGPSCHVVWEAGREVFRHPPSCRLDDEHP